MIRHLRGVSILSYGDRPNEYESVVQYFRAHFLQVHRKTNENRRVLYTHLTNVTVGVLVPRSIEIPLTIHYRTRKLRRALSVTVGA